MTLDALEKLWFDPSATPFERPLCPEGIENGYGEPNFARELTTVSLDGEWAIVLPLSTASIATVSLFIILGHWNAWFDGMIYIRVPEWKPLQTYLRSVVIVDAGEVISTNIDDFVRAATADGSSSAKIFVALLPIMAVYPFVQKYFVKGVVLGSVKE